LPFSDKKVQPGGYWQFLCLMERKSYRLGVRFPFAVADDCSEPFLGWCSEQEMSVKKTSCLKIKEKVES